MFLKTSYSAALALFRFWTDSCEQINGACFRVEKMPEARTNARACRMEVKIKAVKSAQSTW